MISLRSTIQREIIAVKHALANGIPHEGVACGEDLELLLQDLQAHRAEVIASSKQQQHNQFTNNAIPGQQQKPQQQESPLKSMSTMFTTPKSRAYRAKNACPVPRPGPGSTGGGSSSSIMSSSSSKFARVPIPNSGSISASSSSSKKRKLQVDRDRASATGTTKASEAHKRSVQISPPPPDANKAGLKSGVDFLRQIRRGIEIGDVLSVLLDVRQPGGWSRQWVRGQVMQTVSQNNKLNCTNYRKAVSVEMRVKVSSS